MRPVSDTFLDAANSSHRAHAEITVTPPGSSDASELAITDGSVSISGDGSRYSASLTLSPDVSRDLYALVSTPGAIFKIRSGIALGDGQIEWADAGVYEATAGNKPLQVGAMPLTLVDQTTRLTRCRFLSPWSASAGARSDALEAMVLDAIPDASVVKINTGGTMATALFDKDRTGAIAQIRDEGGLDAAFEAAGRFSIAKQRILTPTAPVWTARTGKVSNITSATREKPLDRMYNCVVVQPIDETQTWAQQVVRIKDTTHPRHRDKIGDVPFFYSSASLVSDSDAKAMGGSVLQMLLGTTERIQLSLLGNPALEYGDTIAVAAEMTPTDPGLAGSYLLETSTLNLITHAQEVTARSSSLADLEEV